MKITFRLIVSLFVAAALVAGVFSYLQVENERNRLRQELTIRALATSEGLTLTLTEHLRTGSIERLKRVVERFGARTRLVGIAVYDSQGVNIALSPVLRTRLQITPNLVWESITTQSIVTEIGLLDSVETHFYAVPLHLEERIFGSLLLIHDASFIEARLTGIWRTNFLRLLTQIVLITIITVLVVRWSITGPIAQIAKWMRGLRTGKVTYVT
jgi:trehalose 6-phosphate synthase